MTRALQTVEAVIVLAFLAATLALLFPVHGQLYAWPWYGVALLAFTWLYCFAYATNLLRPSTGLQVPYAVNDQDDSQELLQYAALIALAHAEGQDLLPILEQARDTLTRWGFRALVKFAARVR